MIDFYELEKRLIKLQGKIETVKELKKYKGENFNIFSILNIERFEVKTHSALIYELINPKGSHNQSKKYLEIFIADILNIKDFDFNSAKVNREHLTDTNRRIDFTIEDNNNFIVIEMKIDAKDQINQLSDYKKFADKKKKRTRCYYLTLNGNDASELSTKGISYERISFSFHILNWINKSIEKSFDLPIIRESLTQYKILIEKLTNKHTKEIEMEVLKMINTPDLIESATILSENIGLIWAKKEAIFWDEVKNRTSKVNTDIILDSSIYFFEKDVIEINYTSQEELTQKVNEKRSAKNIEFGIRYKLNRNGEHFNCYLYLYNSSLLSFQIGDDIIESSLVIDISKKISITGVNKNARYKETDTQINFYGKNNSKDLSYEIFDSQKFEDKLNKISSEVNNYIAKFKQ
ncbi:PD-(D/E)XK nuclease family protein [Poseidonibacter lekithochrous]|uniref:PDDEXK-like family protein n=1 Tax=Poseidonibacter lekithochrous TaxID=1904463 RepID=UPI0008FC7015|nr:PD-(D/E)XK nuclease family protein [Poseidonibacter lekithochrous]QKJ22956.1 hypothetical protein ALEK_1688 [Poseidonibacter lekithochrous]